MLNLLKMDLFKLKKTKMFFIFLGIVFGVTIDEILIFQGQSQLQIIA